MRSSVSYRSLGLVLVLLTISTHVVPSQGLAADRPANAPALPARVPARQGNVWGINLGFDPSASTVATVRLLGLARVLVGDWGYIRHGFSPSEDLEAARRGIAMIRAYHLIPIVGGAAPDKQFCEPGKRYPRTDPDGSMRTAARAKAVLWKKLFDARIPFYAVEVMNEVNVDKKWPPEKYAQWLYDYAVEVKEAYPGLKVCSCGMAGSGEDYYDKMLTSRPELKRVVDFWGLHPYGANNPPEKEPAETTLRSYELTARVLAKHGVSPIHLMCTETGYELEIGAVGKNPQYPAINEENRADYMVRAFRHYYAPDPRIEMVSPFLLWDLSWHGWDGWSYMGNDGRPKPIYLRSMAEPKPPGKDWMPTGQAVIEGRITWQNTDIGIPRVIVYAQPGLYGAVTDDSGRYRIEGLPDGQYIVQAFADGYRTTSPQRVTTSRIRSGKHHANLTRESLIAGFTAASGAASAGKLEGWQPLNAASKDGVYQVDTAVRDAERRPTLRLELKQAADVGLYRYGSHHSAYPGEVYLAEAFVRATASPTKFDVEAGPWLELATTNGRGELLATARATAPDFAADGKWYRITAACWAPPRSSRVRVSLGVGGAAGTFWFSAPFVGEADFPLPADAKYKTAGYVPPLYDQNKRLFAQASVDLKARNPSLQTGHITGTVTDFRNRAVPRAVVATDSPLFVAITDGQGRFNLTAPSGPEMRARIFAEGMDALTSNPLRLAAGETTRLDLHGPAPKAPPALVNGGFNRFTPGNPGQLHGWYTFGSTDGSVASKKSIFKVPAYEGEGMYLAQAGSNVKNGGAWQIVQARRSRKYRLSAQVYTCTEDEGKRPLDNNCRIGIDPTGGRDPDSKDIIWTAPTESQEKWTPIGVEAVAQCERITVFIRHEMRRANTWNLTLFDDVQLKSPGE